MRFLKVYGAMFGLACLTLAACGDGGSGNDSSATPASIQIVSGSAQTGVAGAELPVALGVAVFNASGQPVVGASVTWSVTAGGGSVSPSLSTTDNAGLATTRWTLGTILGAVHRATARVGAIPAVTFEATAIAANTVSVSVTSSAGMIYEGDSVQLVATARDASGNILPDRSVTWISGDSTHFPVSVTGMLQTWSDGQVNVIAEVDGVRGELLITIKAIELEVAIGAKQVVIDWTQDRCEDLDVPDGPARFVRIEDGSLVLFSGNAPRYFVSRGADFGSLARDCRQPALVSADSALPDTYENWEWLWAIYRDGSTWHALVHNEFHDPMATTCRLGDTSPGNPCWYNSVTYATSTDGARSFSKSGAPAHTVAPAPYPWVPPDAGAIPVGNGFVEGYFNPSNIVRGPDGYFYSFLMAIPTQNWTSQQGLCVFRTATLADPSTWRAWDGQGFSLRMTSPYVTGESAPVCAFLDTVMSAGQVVYNSYLERYMFISTSQGAFDVDGQLTCGFFYALSADLVHWSEHRLLVEAQLPWCAADLSRPGVLESVTVGYPSIVDHSDTSINFEMAGRTPYLYYTRFNDGGLDRDLVRVPLTLTRRN